MTPLLETRPTTALVWNDDRIGYDELLRRARAWSRDLGGADERVVVFSENRLEWVYAAYAIWAANGRSWSRSTSCRPRRRSPTSSTTARPGAVYCSAKTRPVVERALTLASHRPRLLDMERDGNTGRTGAGGRGTDRRRPGRAGRDRLHLRHDRQPEGGDAVVRKPPGQRDGGRERGVLHPRLAGLPAAPAAPRPAAGRLPDGAAVRRLDDRLRDVPARGGAGRDAQAQPGDDDRRRAALLRRAGPRLPRPDRGQRPGADAVRAGGQGRLAALLAADLRLGAPQARRQAAAPDLRRRRAEPGDRADLRRPGLHRLRRLRDDRVRADDHLPAAGEDQARNLRPGSLRHRGEDGRRRDRDPRPEHDDRRLQPAGGDRGDHPQRLAAHRRPGPVRRRGVPDDHRAAEGDHHPAERQERESGADRGEPAGATGAVREAGVFLDGETLHALVVPNWDGLPIADRGAAEEWLRREVLEPYNATVAP